jgi:hypothetical protein
MPRQRLNALGTKLTIKLGLAKSRELCYIMYCIMVNLPAWAVSFSQLIGNCEKKAGFSRQGQVLFFTEGGSNGLFD